jgi:hypothetical protein
LRTSNFVLHVPNLVSKDTSHAGAASAARPPIERRAMIAQNAARLHARLGSSQFTRRRVRLMLRHGRVVEGNIHVIEGQSLTLFLATRRFFVNLTESSWGRGGGERLQHVGVRTDHVYWAAALTTELQVSSTMPPTGMSRWAEIVMDDGVVIHVSLYIAEEQRLTDYIDAASGFLPVRQAIVLDTGERLGEVVVNTGAVLAIREIEAREP